jgi:hypothetical protein
VSPEALRLSSAAWQILAATEGLVGKAWHEPEKASNEVRVNIKESMIDLRACFDVFRQARSADGLLLQMLFDFGRDDIICHYRSAEAQALCGISGMSHISPLFRRVQNAVRSFTDSEAFSDFVSF